MKIGYFPFPKNDLGSILAFSSKFIFLGVLVENAVAQQITQSQSTNFLYLSWVCLWYAIFF
jgi:hypothetical protein